MRAQNPFVAQKGALIGGYSARLAEALAVRKAEFEARQARAEAELSIRARSEFLANMNHELRTPLNAIIGFSTMLRDTDSYTLSDDQRRTYAEYVIQSADLLLGHINSLLETAALDSGTVDIQDEEFDVAALLAESVKRSAVAAGAAEVTIENRSGEGALPGRGDEIRLGQAVEHLIRIALKSSEQGGKVFVRAAADAEGRPEIAIRDRGAGLSPEEIRKALGVFDEVHRGLDRSFSGAGVGLAIAKTFVEMQGGRFDIKSKPGEGTIVRIVMKSAGQSSATADDQTETLRRAG